MSSSLGGTSPAPVALAKQYGIRFHLSLSLVSFAVARALEGESHYGTTRFPFVGRLAAANSPHGFAHVIGEPPEFLQESERHVTSNQMLFYFPWLSLEFADSFHQIFCAHDAWQGGKSSSPT